MKILVVDDELDVQELYKQRFRKEIRSNELTILFATSAKEALEILGQMHPMDIVLLLSDINMPGMTGLDLLKLAKAEYPWLTIYMITAYGDDESREKAKQLGAKEYLTKPIDFSLLHQKIFAA